MASDFTWISFVESVDYLSILKIVLRQTDKKQRIFYLLTIIQRQDILFKRITLFMET